MNPLEALANSDLLDRMETICFDLPGYGYRRVTAQLKRDGLVVNHKKVLRLMRKSDLLCQTKGTNSNPFGNS
jgi:putative transposase